MDRCSIEGRGKKKTDVVGLGRVEEIVVDEGGEEVSEGGAEKDVCGIMFASLNTCPGGTGGQANVCSLQWDGPVVGQVEVFEIAIGKCSKGKGL